MNDNGKEITRDEGREDIPEIPEKQLIEAIESSQGDLEVIANRLGVSSVLDVFELIKQYPQALDAYLWEVHRFHREIEERGLANIERRLKQGDVDVARFVLEQTWKHNPPEGY